MDRRVFVLGTIGLLAPRSAVAQQAKRLAMLLTGSPTTAAPEHDAFMRQLEALGWIEGQQLAVDRRWGDAPERWADLTVDVVRAKPDVILAAGPDATRAARRATSTIPIVMIAATDPRVLGVASFAHPGGNLTGVTVGPPEAVLEKRLQLLKEAVPALTRAAIIWDVNRSEAPTLGQMATAARLLGVRLQHVDMQTGRDFDAAFAAAKKENAEGVLIVESPRAVASRAHIAELGLKYRLPVISQFGLLVDAGSLLSYGAELSDLFRRAAVYVDKILKGARAGDLPVEQPSKYELVINLRTAKALGLTIPPSLRLRADRVIE